MRIQNLKVWAVLLVGVVVTSTAMVIAMGVGTKPVEAAFPGTNGKIAFNSDRDGNSEIYRMNSDGISQQNLTLSSDRDVTAEWSPNGKQMAFFSDRDGNFEVYTMNSDGTRIRRLTINGAQDFLPAWSPDGTKIAFQSNRTGDAEVFVMTRTARVLGEPHQGPAGADGSPDWSNNGAKIAFQSNRDGNEEVYAMNSDGSNQTNLTHNAALDAFPAFSADGRRIAFSSDRTTGTGVDNADGDDGIFRMGAGGRGGPTHLQHRD